MNIKNITINNFRLFKNTSIDLGTRLTVIAGSNAVGKSTILGLLGHCSELKIKDGRPILKPQFRCEWTEIFKLSPGFDITNSNVATITFNTNETMKYRITWQNNKTRGRLIPNSVNKDGNKSSAKKSWPTLYLGLSRLYPLGEALISEKDIKQIKISRDFINIYKSILSIDDNITYANEVHLSEISQKISVGICTDTYDHLANSAGQDNLSQIILAIESFQKLKDKMGEKYEGGLLLIDELDAALHPSAQYRLIDYMYKKSKELTLQIVFTTHSLSTLNHLQKYKKSQNELKIHYFSRANYEKNPVHYVNPDMELITNLLSSTTSYTSPKKVKVITEDAESRWLINNILQPEDQKYITLLETSIGYNELLSLANCDITFLQDRIVVLDGDVKNKKSALKKIEELNKRGGHILLLPDNVSLEASLYNFLISNSLSVLKYYQEPLHTTRGATKSHFKENNPLSPDNRKNREKYKKWFNNNKALFDETHLYDYWSQDYKSDIEQFIEEMKKHIKKIRENFFI